MDATSATVSPTRPIWPRLLANAAALVAVPVLAFIVGEKHYSAVNCSGADFDGECDVAAVEGMVSAFGGFVLACLAVLASEPRRTIRRRRAPS